MPTSLTDALNNTGSQLPTPSPTDVKSKTPDRPAMAQLAEDDSRVQEATQDRDKFTKEGRPAFPTLAEPPKDDKPDDPMKGYVSAIGILGGIGSMFTRTPMVHSMNAAAGVLQGMKADDAAAFKQKFDTWKVQNDNALKLYDYQNDTYKAILGDKNKSVDERIGELKAHAAAFKDDMMLKLAEDRNPSVIEDNMAKADAARTKWEKSSADIAVRGEKVALAKQQIADAEAAGKPMTPEAKMKLLTEAMSDKVAAGGDKVGLDPDAVKANAAIYLKTGQAPNLGMGAKEDKEAVQNEAARIAKEQGVSVDDIIFGRVAFKADSAALTTSTRNAVQIEGFEFTAKKNMENALSLMDKGAGTEAGSVINRWLQAGKQATGDPDVKTFNAAIETAITEYAKVMSGAVGATALTDSARQEAHQQILSQIDSPAAIRAVYEKVMVPDMENRKAGYENQRKVLRDSLKNETSAKDASSQETPPVEGAKKAPDGKWYVPDPKRPGKYLQVNQ